MRQEQRDLFPTLYAGVDLLDDRDGVIGGREQRRRRPVERRGELGQLRDLQGPAATLVVVEGGDVPPDSRGELLERETGGLARACKSAAELDIVRVCVHGHHPRSSVCCSGRSRSAPVIVVYACLMKVMQSVYLAIGKSS